MPDSLLWMQATELFYKTVADDTFSEMSNDKHRHPVHDRIEATTVTTDNLNYFLRISSKYDDHKTSVLHPFWVTHDPKKGKHLAALTRQGILTAHFADTEKFSDGYIWFFKV